MSARRQCPEPAKETGTGGFSINPLPMHTALLELSSLEEINKYVSSLPASRAEGRVSPESPQRDGGVSSSSAGIPWHCCCPPVLPLIPAAVCWQPLLPTALSIFRLKKWLGKAKFQQAGAVWCHLPGDSDKPPCPTSPSSKMRSRGSEGFNLAPSLCALFSSRAGRGSERF